MAAKSKATKAAKRRSLQRAVLAGPLHGTYYQIKVFKKLTYLVLYYYKTSLTTRYTTKLN